jgi:peptide deformylase
MQVLLYPEPQLREPCQEVSSVDEELMSFIHRMSFTVRAHRGVGLAASQVGVPKRIAVLDLDPTKHNPIVIINPVITKRSDETIVMHESCLSLPGITAPVVRAKEVTVDVVDLEGKKVTLQLSDLSAGVLQHELDHLDGVLFIDRLTPAAKRRHEKTLRLIQKGYRQRPDKKVHWTTGVTKKSEEEKKDEVERQAGDRERPGVGPPAVGAHRSEPDARDEGTGSQLQVQDAP